MTDVFDRTARSMERERQLLERNGGLFGPLAAPVADIPPVKTSETDLVYANQGFNPATLTPGTRYGAIKRFLLRLLSLYTNGQVEFNGSVVRVLNGWSQRLGTLSAEISGRLHDLQEQSNQRFVLVEQRRNVRESLFTGELNALRDRMSELETDLAGIQLRLEEQQARIVQLDQELANARVPVGDPGSTSAAR